MTIKKLFVVVATFSVLVIALSISYYFFWFLPHNQTANKSPKTSNWEKISGQISDLEIHLSDAHTIINSCENLVLQRMRHEDEGNLTAKCCSMNDFSKWARNTPFYPELLNTKRDLLDFTDSAEEYSFGICLSSSNLKDGDYRGKLEEKLQIQETTIKEDIMKLQSEYK